MYNTFSKFNNEVDIDGLQEDIKKAAENNRNYKEVPLDTYEVKVEKMELTLTGEKSKNPGMPMVTIWFKIVAGEYKGSIIFYNKVILGTSDDGYMLHLVNELLKSLQSGMAIEFKGYDKYAQLLLDIHECIDGKLEYALDYGENKQGYKTYEIINVFEVNK